MVVSACELAYYIGRVSKNNWIDRHDIRLSLIDYYTTKMILIQIVLLLFWATGAHTALHPTLSSSITAVGLWRHGSSRRGALLQESNIILSTVRGIYGRMYSGKLGAGTVSYTHLTLPTIYSV